MDILGIGPLELFFIIIIALIVLGPKDMVKAGKTIGRFLRKVVTSPEWRTVRQASQDFRQLPTRLIREAGLEEMQELEELKRMAQPQALKKQMGLDEFEKEVKGVQKGVKGDQSDLSDWTTPARSIQPPTTKPLEEAEPAPETDPAQD